MSATAQGQRHAPPTGDGAATTLPSPRAIRLRRPGWRDPRLLLGVVLIGCSVLLGSWAVSSAGRTVPVLVATQALVPGEQLGPDSVRAQDVRLPDGGAAYVRAGQELDADLVVARTVAAGELVPWSALTSSGDLDLRPVAVEPSGRLPASVVPGSVVDLWYVPAVAASAGGGTSTGAAPGPATPQQLVAGLTVAEVAEPAGAFSAGSGVTVHVLVPADDLPRVLGALSAEGTVEVVPVVGAARTP